MMKKTIYLSGLLTALALTSACQRYSKLQQDEMRQDSINTVLQDSIATANAEKDSLMALMNDIADEMSQIKEMQDIISVKDLSGETPDRKQQLRDDIMLIKQHIEQNQKRLAELEKRLKQSTNYNADMKKSIASMKQQIEMQQNTIDELTKQLAAAHIEIEQLNKNVDSLTVANQVATHEKEQAQAESKRLSEEVTELNTCYYVIGSKKELKNNKIIETGFLRKTKILEGDYQLSYFTKADRRTLSEIPLYSKKAELLTNHPEGSYLLEEHGNMLTLHIIDNTKFWSFSNFLVIKVD